MITDKQVEAAQAAYRAHVAEHGVDGSTEAMRAALEAAERAAWQTIETAPKDGTYILLGRFVQYCEYGHAGMMVIDRYSRPEDNRGWIGWGKFSHLWGPTHWRPLPPAPETAE